MAKHTTHSQLQTLERQLHGKDQLDRPQTKITKTTSPSFNFSADKVIGTTTTIAEDQHYLRQDLIKTTILASLILAIQLISYWFLR